MRKILIEIFECSCCKFVENVVRNSIRGYEDKVEYKNYSLPKDRSAFEKYGIIIKESNGIINSLPLVVISKGEGKEVRIEKINRISIRKALDHILSN